MSSSTNNNEQRRKIPLGTMLLAGATVLSLTIAIVVLMRPTATTVVVQSGSTTSNGSTTPIPVPSGLAPPATGSADSNLAVGHPVVPPAAASPTPGGKPSGGSALGGSALGGTAVGGTAVGGNTVVNIDNRKPDPVPVVVPPPVVPPEVKLPNPYSGITIQVGKLLLNGSDVTQPTNPFAKLDSTNPNVLFDFLPNPSGDGSFDIRGSDGKCYYPDGFRGKCPVYLNTRSLWYVQPTTKDADYLGTPADVANLYRIRSTRTDDCASFSTLQGSDGMWAFTCASNDGDRSEKYVNGSYQQKLILRNPAHEELINEALYTLATLYAATQVDAKSPLITVSNYEIDKYGPVILGKAINATVGAPSYTNGGAGAANYTMNWSYSNSSSATVGTSWGISASYTYEWGGTANFLFGSATAKTTISVGTMYGGSQSTTNTHSETVGNQVSLPINPGQSGWIMRSNLVRIVDGHWNFTTDMGDVWTGKVAITVDVPDTNGAGLYSRVVLCTSDSTLQVCRDNQPLSSK